MTRHLLLAPSAPPCVHGHPFQIEPHFESQVQYMDVLVADCQEADKAYKQYTAQQQG